MSANQERERRIDELMEMAREAFSAGSGRSAMDNAIARNSLRAKLASLLRESAPDTPRFTTADASAFMEWWHKQEWTPDAFTKVADWLNRRQASLPAAPRQDDEFPTEEMLRQQDAEDRMAHEMLVAESERDVEDDPPICNPVNPPPLFSYDGPIYVRPIGRGICYGGDDALEFSLEDAVPDGYYEASIVIRERSTGGRDTTP